MSYSNPSNQQGRDQAKENLGYVQGMGQQLKENVNPQTTQQQQEQQSGKSLGEYVSDKWQEAKETLGLGSNPQEQGRVEGRQAVEEKKGMMEGVGEKVKEGWVNTKENIREHLPGQTPEQKGQIEGREKVENLKGNLQGVGEGLSGTSQQQQGTRMGQ